MQISVRIIVDGTERVYIGTYDELYNSDWAERVQDQIDVVNDQHTMEL